MCSEKIHPRDDVCRKTYSHIPSLFDLNTVNKYAAIKQYKRKPGVKSAIAGLHCAFLLY